MTIWQNLKYGIRNYECTNKVAAVTEDDAYPNCQGKPLEGRWGIANNLDLYVLTPLYAIGNTHFYGHL